MDAVGARAPGVGGVIGDSADCAEKSVKPSLKVGDCTVCCCCCCCCCSVTSNGLTSCRRPDCGLAFGVNCSAGVVGHSFIAFALKKLGVQNELVNYDDCRRTQGCNARASTRECGSGGMRGSCREKKDLISLQNQKQDWEKVDRPGSTSDD